LRIDTSSDLPSGLPQRRTQWTDFWIDSLSANNDGTRLCFLRSSLQSDIYIGDLQAHGTRLVALRPVTAEEAYNRPISWTLDGRTILLDSDRDGGMSALRVYKQDTAKDAAELMTSGPGVQYGPHISPDGDWVVYVWIDDKSGKPEERLMRVPLSGGPAQEIFPLDGNLAGF
jgi:Tol biopolymer transport system component